MKKTYAVFGLGRYGKTITQELVNNGADVLAVDMYEDVVNEAAATIPFCKCANVTDKEVLTQLGISEVDTVIIAMASHLEDTVMATMLCKELGVPQVIVKCGDDFKAKILLKVGADRVVIPEKESGIRLAKSLLGTGVLDVIDLSKDVSVVEMQVKEEWVGKSLVELDLRRKYDVSVIAIKQNDTVVAAIDPTIPFTRDMKLYIIASTDKIQKLTR